MDKLVQLKAEIIKLDWQDKVMLWDWICDEVEPHLEPGDELKRAIEDHKTGKLKFHPLEVLDA